MELKIFWTDFSKQELKTIYEFYKEKAGSKIAKKLVSGIARETQVLKKYPYLGQVEELLDRDPREFRYLIYKNYKIIYHVIKDNNTIEVFDVFDTRQNPSKITRVE